MKYFLEVTMDNAAFEDAPGEELARILRAAADRVSLFSFTHEKTSYPVSDTNGNHVGKHGYENAEGDQ